MADPLMREVDARRRISLTGVGDPEHRYYLASCDDSGVIVLTPAVILPAADVERMRQEATADG
jgi:hypothetical protein